MESMPLADIIPATVRRAAIAWNNAQHALFHSFLILSGFSDEVAKSVYFAVRSDRNQRDMVTQLVNHKLEPLNSKLAKRFRRAIGTVDSLSGKRNDALHVVYINTLDSSKTSLFHDIGFLKGKSGDDLVEAILNMTMEILDVAIEIQTLNEEAQSALQIRARLVQALLQGSSQQILAGLTNQPGYGLLGGLANTPPPLRSDGGQPE